MVDSNVVNINVGLKMVDGQNYMCIYVYVYVYVYGFNIFQYFSHIQLARGLVDNAKQKTIEQRNRRELIEFLARFTLGVGVCVLTWLIAMSCARCR